MYEIIIIICLAVALFLLLRHFPETNPDGPKKKFRFWDLFRKRRKLIALSEIEEAVLGKSEPTIAPVEIENAQKAFAESDPELAGILMQATEAYNNNDLRVAEELAIDALNRSKRCASAYLMVGKVAFSRGNFEEAKESLKASLKCNHEIGETYFWLGRIELKNENYTGAIEYLQSAVVLGRTQPEWLAQLGEAYLEVRQFAKASKALKRAASLDIDNKDYKELANVAEEKMRSHANVARMK